MASEVSIDDLVAAKDKGNYYFKNHQYKDAIDAYGKGLSLLEEHKVEELSEDQQEIQAKLAANQAQCFILVEDYEACVDACNSALRCLPAHKKALFRRSFAYENLEQPTDAMEDLRELLRIDPKNEQIIEASRRVGVKVKQEWDIKQSFHTYVKQLVHNPTSDKKSNIAMVLKHMQSSETYHKPVCTSGFIEKLQTMVLDNREVPESKILAIKGLRSVFSILGDSAKLKISKFEGFIQNLIGLMRYGNGVSNEELNRALEYHCALLLATMAADKSFQPLDGDYLVTVAEAFSEFFVASSLVKKGSTDSFDRQQWNRIDHSLKALGYMATLSPKALSVCRTKCLPHLLLSSLTDDIDLQSSLIGCLVAFSMKGVDEATDKSKESKKKKKGKKKAKKAEVNKLATPSDFYSICQSWVTRFLMSSSDVSIVRGLRALSLVLRASPETGFKILAEQEMLQKVVDLTESDGENKLLAAEVLALASSDTRIRRSISSAGHFELFLGLLKSSDVSVRSHAALALSKYAAGDETVRQFVLKDASVLTAMMEVLDELVTPPNEEKSSDSPEFSLDTASALVQMTVSTVVETITYLCIHVETKEELSKRNSGEWLKRLLQFSTSSNRAIQHGLIQIILQMTMSTEDRKQMFNSELEQLKRVAQRGMMKKQTKEREFMEERAGSVEAIQAIRSRLVEHGAVKAVTDCFTIHERLGKETDHLVNKKQESTPGNPSSAEGFQEAVATILCNIVSAQEHRGFVVQQGGLRTLLDVSKGSSAKAKTNTAIAIARILVTTNPHLVPESVLPGAIDVMLQDLKESAHELHQFEMMMALTNLASMGEEMRNRLMKLGVWSACMDVLTSDNYKCQRSAVELMSTVVLCDAAFEKLLKSGDQDIRLVLLFAKTDDVETVRAAAGFVANIAHQPELAKIIQKHDGVLIMKALSSHDDEAIKVRSLAALKGLRSQGIE